MPVPTSLPTPATRGRPPVGRRRGVAAGLLAAAIAASLLAVAPVAAGGTHYYVDGKKGSDSFTGTSLSSAFRTLGRALALARNGGVTISVVGYEGFSYFETLTKPYSMYGTASSPVVIEGYRPSSGPFVRPTISGAKIVSQPGSNAWTRPSSSSYPNVWCIPWSSPILGYESSRRTSRFDIVFMDGTNQLRRPVDKPTRAQLQSTPGSQYWDGRDLCVHLGVWGGGSVDTNPNHHLISVPQYMGIAVNNDSSYVTIRDLRIIHTAGAIAFYAGTNHGTVKDVELSYNFVLGLYSEGDDMAFTNVTGRRNGLQLMKLDRGAQRNVVTKAYAVEHPGQGVKITGSTTSHHTIKYSTFLGGAVPTWVASYGGETQGIDIEQGTHDNLILGNTIRGMGRGLMLYQYDSTGGPLNRNRIERNYFDGNYRAVVLWDGRSGADGTGSVTFYRNTYRRNGNAIYAPTVSKNKTFKNETIFDTVGGAGTGYDSAIYLLGSGTRITLQNVIFNKGRGYGIYAGSGAMATATYTHVSSMARGRSKGSVTWSTGSTTRSPSFLSIDPASAAFLTIDQSSSLYTAGSGGTPAGARWK